MRSLSKTSKTCALLLALIMVTSVFMFSSTEYTYAAAASKFSITGHNTPSVLKKGKSFSIKGTIKSTYKMNSVKVGVVNSKGKWVKAATYSCNPKAKSFNILKKQLCIKIMSMNIMKMYEMQPLHSHYSLTHLTQLPILRLYQM